MCFCALQFHHVVTCIVYAHVLHSRQLSALACMGLVFELPVAVLNIREVID